MRVSKEKAVRTGATKEAARLVRARHLRMGVDARQRRLDDPRSPSQPVWLQGSLAEDAVAYAIAATRWEIPGRRSLSTDDVSEYLFCGAPGRALWSGCPLASHNTELPAGIRFLGTSRCPATEAIRKT